MHGVVERQKELESLKSTRNRWITNTIRTLQLDSTHQAGNPANFLQERQHLEDEIQVTIGKGLRDLRRLSVQAETSFYIEHFSRSSGELDSDDHSSIDDCRDPDHPGWDHPEWDGIAEGQTFENCTMELGRVDLEPDAAEPGAEHATAEKQTEILADVPRYGVPLYQLKGNLLRGA